MILQRTSWVTYARLLDERQETAGTRFNYDRGTFEIRVLWFEHESLKHILALIVELLAGAKWALTSRAQVQQPFVAKI